MNDESVSAQHGRLPRCGAPRCETVTSVRVFFLVLLGFWNCGGEPREETTSRLAHGNGLRAGVERRAEASAWHDPTGRFELVAEYGRGSDAWLGWVLGLDVSSDGTVYAYDGPNSRVIAFSSDLIPLHEFGRSGRGPGDLTPVRWLRGRYHELDYLAVFENHVAVYDGLAISVFLSDGTLIRRLDGTTIPRFFPYSVKALEPTETGFLLTVDFRDRGQQTGRKLQTYLVGDHTPTILFEVTLALPPIVGGSGFYSGPRQARPLWAGDRDYFYAMNGQDPFVFRYARTSGQLDSIRLPEDQVWPNRSESEASARSEMRQLVEMSGQIGIGKIPPATSIWNWAELAVDPDGYLWVRPWRPRREGAGEIPVVMVQLASGIATFDTVPAFPQAFGVPGEFYSLSTDTTTDVPLIQKWSMRPKR